MGRCLELTAIVDGSVHSRGGGCSFSPDPTAGAWDLARPLRFSIGDSPIITLFGRAGVDVAGIRIAESPGSIATDVRGVWLIVTKATDSSVFIESFDGDGENLLSEQVPISAVDASILDVEGLIAELRIARATVNRLPREAGGDGPPFFAGEASAICLNGRQVRLYEYPSRADRDRDSISITKEGQIERPGTLIIAEWVGPPHFFAGGRIIVLHLGEDQDILTLLTNILGPTLSPDGVGSRGTGDLPCDDEP